jgi:alkanesulfonate monooxygenase SsuD/methylene tetrahydromethanopterin reductase-like flavin-dependent oxidoreductase (luciferase family)
MELGLYSFAENTPDPLNGGHLQSPAERLRDLLEEIELADQLGLAFYGLGEHHRDDPCCRRRADPLDPPEHGGYSAQLGRSGARLAAVLDA